MKQLANRIRKIDTTLKIFLLCFAVYFIANCQQK